MKGIDAPQNEICYTYGCSGRIMKVERKDSLRGVAEEGRIGGENLAGMQNRTTLAEAWNGVSDSNAGGQPTAELIQATTYT